MKRLLLIEQPEVKISECQIPKGMVQTGTFDAGYDRKINGLIPMTRCFFETNRAVIFNAHVVLVHGDVLFEKWIILDQVQAEIISRQNLVDLRILKKVHIRCLQNQFIGSKRA